jgi:membrane protein YqaA with SNARE-associated domain
MKPPFLNLIRLSSSGHNLRGAPFEHQQALRRSRQYEKLRQWLVLFFALLILGACIVNFCWMNGWIAYPEWYLSTPRFTGPIYEPAPSPWNTR